MLLYNTKLKKYSQELRKNMTDAERLLWSKLKGRQMKGYQIYRQKIIGNYIVDFYCPKANLVVEVDGGQHYTEKGLKEDRIRNDNLRAHGFKVLRFSDREVFENLTGVVERIFENLGIITFFGVCFGV